MKRFTIKRVRGRVAGCPAAFGILVFSLAAGSVQAQNIDTGGSSCANDAAGTYSGAFSGDAKSVQVFAGPYLAGWDMTFSGDLAKQMFGNNVNVSEVVVSVNLAGDGVSFSGRLDRSFDFHSILDVSGPFGGSCEINGQYTLTNSGTKFQGSFSLKGALASTGGGSTGGASATGGLCGAPSAAALVTMTAAMVGAKRRRRRAIRSKRSVH